MSGILMGNWRVCLHVCVSCAVSMVTQCELYVRDVRGDLYFRSVAVFSSVRFSVTLLAGTFFLAKNNSSVFVHAFLSTHCDTGAF